MREHVEALAPGRRRPALWRYTRTRTAGPLLISMATEAQTGWVRVFRARHDIAVTVGGVLEPDELARVVVERARELLDGVGLYVYDDAESAMAVPLLVTERRLEQHGGRVEIDAWPGRGTTVSLHLPPSGPVEAGDGLPGERA
jgi:hypothetical protein